jgi:cytochrome c2
VSSTRLLACGVVLVSGVAFAQPLFSRTQDPQAGARVFDAKGCVKCHAVRGVGGKVGPDLGRALRPRTFYDLAAALWNHASKMAWNHSFITAPPAGREHAPWPTFRGEDMADLMAYLRSFKTAR